MANKIIIKNGPEAPSATNLDLAELGYAVGLKKVYAGNGYTSAPTCINPLDIDINGSNSGNPANINADTLGGRPAEDYATNTEVNVAIENALVLLHKQILTGAW